MFERTRAAALRLAVLCGAALGVASARAEPSVAIVPLGFPVEAFRGPDSYLSRVLPTSTLLGRDKPAGLDRIVSVWGPEGGAALVLRDGAIRTIAWPATDAASPLAEAPRDAVPGTRMQTAGPLTVYLSQPRDDANGLSGDQRGAGAVTLSERQPLGGPQTTPRPVPVKTARVEAGPDAVLADPEPRLVDLDRDGTPEVLVVKSYPAKGSALAVIGRRDDVWTTLAETPPTDGLALAAVADFEDDGRIGVALVRAPQGEGVLQLWAWDGAKLTLRREQAGYSGRAPGSAAPDLAAVVDLDGGPALALPTLDRAALAVLSLKGGVRELWRVPLPARALTGVAALGSGKAAHILVGLEDGRIADVRP